MKNILVSVLGPTATGKTNLAVRLAHEFNGEIISADSRQVYRKMDIGTGKDIDEYSIDGRRINYHLIDIAEPSEEFNLFLYKKKFIETYKEIVSKGKIPFLAGGTGLYLSAVIQDYKLKESDTSPESLNNLESLSDEQLRERILAIKKVHNKTDLVSRQRLINAIFASTGLEVLSFPVDACIIGVYFPREIIRGRITERLKNRLESGMIEEVKLLMRSGISNERLLAFGLEYKYITLYLTGEISYSEMFEKLNTAIHQFAKRQMTWFRKMEREGVKINWIEQGNFKEASKIVKAFLDKRQD